MDFIRTVCEMMGKDKFIGYSPEGNKMKLIYTQKTFNAYLQKDGHWHEILFKNIWKVNERVFNSVTVGEDGKIYLKVVNVSGQDEEMEADLVNFGPKSKVTQTTLWHEDPTVINEIKMKAGKTHNIEPTVTEYALEGTALKATVKNNSVNVFVIE